jgi:hypothetical protein
LTIRSIIAASQRSDPAPGVKAGNAALRGVRERIPEVADRTFELTEFLVDRLGVVHIGASLPHRVTLHRHAPLPGSLQDWYDQPLPAEESDVAVRQPGAPDPRSR